MVKIIKKLMIMHLFAILFFFYPAGAFSTDFSFEQEFTVFKVKSETKSPTPSDRSRTTIGIGEEVNLSTDPATTVSWSVTGGGSVSETSGSSTKFTASKSPSNSTIRASVSSKVIELQFSIIAPDGMTSTIGSEPSLGTSGPPNRLIGAKTIYDCFVTPATVSFYNIELRENIPSHTWTWPDGTVQNYGPKYVNWSVSYDNKTTDSVSTGLIPITQMWNGTTYVSFTSVTKVPEEYKNETSTWTIWLGGETHNNEFRGSDQKARVSLNATNNVFGTWQGPWQ